MELRSRQIVESGGLDREALLAKCHDGDGPQYTQALAYAIPYLEGGAQAKGRRVLVDRLNRMPGKTLDDHLRDDDPEIRRAALLVCDRKE